VTSLAPLAISLSLIILRICVPRTMESSQITIRFPQMSSGIATNFMLAIKSRVDCSDGM